MPSKLTIIRAMSDPQLFGPWFKGKSWDSWRVFLHALYGLRLTPKQAAIYGQFTHRAQVPQAVREAWVVVGRRGGKSLVASLIAVFTACFNNYEKHLAPGERGTVILGPRCKRRFKRCCRPQRRSLTT